MSSVHKKTKDKSKEISIEEVLHRRDKLRKYITEEIHRGNTIYYDRKKKFSKKYIPVFEVRYKPLLFGVTFEIISRYYKDKDKDSKRYIWIHPYCNKKSRNPENISIKKFRDNYVIIYKTDCESLETCNTIIFPFSCEVVYKNTDFGFVVYIREELPSLPVSESPKEMTTSASAAESRPSSASSVKSVSFGPDQVKLFNREDSIH
jgi:hypothetical protein